jgi:hypothetical protein
VPEGLLIITEGRSFWLAPERIENKVIVLIQIWKQRTNRKLFPIMGVVGAPINSLPLAFHPFRTFLQVLQSSNTYLLEALYKEYGMYPL